MNFNWWNRSLLFMMLLLWGNLSTVVLHAQTITHKRYSTNNGLPSSTIYYMLQDHEGFIWFGTEAGVSKYDGKKFTNYTLNDGLGENEILTIAEDSRGRIWFLGFNGTLSYYYNGKMHNKTNDALLSNLPYHGTLLYFYEDKSHRLWFTTVLGYIVIDGENVRFITGSMAGLTSPGLLWCNSRNEMTYSPNLYRNYTYTDDGSLLYTAGDSVIRLDENGRHIVISLNKETETAAPAGMALTDDGRLWISTGSNGVFCYDTHDPQKPPEHFLEHSIMSTMMKDHEGNIWVGTLSEGAYMLQPWHGQAITYNAKNSILSNNIHAVTRDSSGAYYAGADEGKLFLINQKGISEVKIKSTNIPYNRVVKVIVKGDDIYAGTDRGVMHYNEKKGINRYISMRQTGANSDAPTRAVKDVCFWRNSIAVSEGYAIYTDSAQRIKYNDEPLISIDRTSSRKYSIFCDAHGILWYSSTDGLHSYDGKTSTHHTVVNNYLGEKITDIAETEDGTLILATYGSGLIFYKDKSVIKTLKRRNGLAHDICKRLVVQRNSIYVATARGITAFTYHNQNVSNLHIYTTANGLASDNVNDVWANDAVICAATTGGLTFLNARAVRKKMPPPNVYITGIEAMDKKILPGTTGNFNYTQHSVHFDFIGISYRSAKGVHYRYRLNATQQWLETDNNSVDYSFLPPGTYRFEVSARIYNGAWSAPATFDFTIASPYWRTWWFGIVVASITLTGIVVLFRYRVRVNAKKQNEELKFKNQITILEQQALQAMMNPHFIFNVMNTIQHAINNSDTHSANIYLSDFARLIRMNLEIAAKRYISLEEEINWLQLYLSLERIRFGTKLTYSIYTDPDIDQYETMIPVMMLQPYIENAIWHGILPLERDGKLEIAIQNNRNGTLKATITDNGVGRKEGGNLKSKSHISRGMQLTEQRLELLSRLTGTQLSISVTDAYPHMPNKGTKVTIILPAALE